MINTVGPIRISKIGVTLTCEGRFKTKNCLRGTLPTAFRKHLPAQTAMLAASILMFVPAWTISADTNPHNASGSVQ